MKIGELSFDSLTNISASNRWVGDAHTDRRIYTDGVLIYKLWSRLYIEGQTFVQGDVYLPVSKPTCLHGFDVNFYREDIAAAFKEFIEDEDGYILGYITSVGMPILRFDDIDGIYLKDIESFLERVWDRCLETDWIPSDICIKNMVKCGDQISLIDYDTHFSRVSQLDVQFEKLEGCLRMHTAPFVRGCVKGFLK